MNIALIYGGKSSEHEVSLVSATSIARNIDTEKHQLHLIGISKTGQWFLQSADELERIRQDAKATLQILETADNQVLVIPGGGKDGALCILDSAGAEKSPYRKLGVDVAFPVLHGAFGEDGTIQGLFEMADLPYVGCGVMGSAIAMDKEKAKQIWSQEKLPIVPYICIKHHQKDNHQMFDQLLNQAERDFTYPMFVKPCSAGSSVGAHKAESRDKLVSAIEDAFLWDEKVLIEPFVNAREIECSVTGNEKITAYTPGEVITSGDHAFYDYDAKYTDPKGASLRIPADLSETQLRDIRELAMKAYHALDLTGLARVDFFIDKKTGVTYLNEVNTLPGFTSISMFPKMCAASGLPYTLLIDALLFMGLERYRNRSNLKTSKG